LLCRVVLWLGTKVTEDWLQPWSCKAARSSEKRWYPIIKL